MPNRPLTPIDVFMGRLIDLNSDGVRHGEPGTRLIVAPIPMHAADAHTQCYSVDITEDGLIRILEQLGVTAEQLAVMLSQPEPRAEAA
ncbi:hypothetical protein ACFVS9_28335 [Streptomyces sp. NPDC058008]|uniref:hypothetical protein n=1 Tax=Streptomyces sp. NPDC058008 TaxID=3346303 RepID=UPI0036EE9A70